MNFEVSFNKADVDILIHREMFNEVELTDIRPTRGVRHYSICLAVKKTGAVKHDQCFYWFDNCKHLDNPTKNLLNLHVGFCVYSPPNQTLQLHASLGYELLEVKY